MGKAIARLDSGTHAVITAGEYRLHLDDPDDGGIGLGPNPEQMLAGTIGACMAMTARLYAARKDWPLEGVEVEVEFERYNATDYPDYDGDAPFVHHFHEKMTLHGPLTEKQRQRIAEIARKCPVRRAVMMPAFFSDELVEAEAETEAVIE